MMLNVRRSDYRLISLAVPDRAHTRIMSRVARLDLWIDKIVGCSRSGLCGYLLCRFRGAPELSLTPLALALALAGTGLVVLRRSVAGDTGWRRSWDVQKTAFVAIGAVALLEIDARLLDLVLGISLVSILAVLVPCLSTSSLPALALAFAFGDSGEGSILSVLLGHWSSHGLLSIGAGHNLCYGFLEWLTSPKCHA